MKKSFAPMGVCANLITVDVENGIIKSVDFSGGCHGNAQGLSKLVAGMAASDVINRLEGIRCGRKPTSCPDQLAKALKEVSGS